MRNPPLTVIYLLAAAIGGLAAAVVWSRREARGAAALGATILAAAFWALCDAFELQADTVAAKRLISQVQYLGVVSAAPFFFHAALRLSGRERPLRGPLWLAVWGIPLLTLPIAWTSQWHTLLWRGITIAADGSNRGVYQYGWWFWVLTVQHYLLLAVASVLLLKAARTVASPFRVPFLAVVIAVLFPWLGNAAYVLKLGPWPGLNYLSISVIISASIFGWMVLREGLFDLLPRTREWVLTTTTDGVLVVSPEGRILLANPAAGRLLRLPVGATIDDSTLGRVTDLHGLAPDVTHELVVSDGSHRRWMEVRADPLHDRWKRRAGTVLVVREITRRKELELEREHLIDRLARTVTSVNLLEDLLPVCAGCKRIRNADGRWLGLDQYVRQRSGPEPVPEYCPDCAETRSPVEPKRN